jgi:hypothetical protein
MKVKTNVKAGQVFINGVKNSENVGVGNLGIGVGSINVGGGDDV